MLDRHQEGTFRHLQELKGTAGMREEGYRSVQIRKSALAALESTAVRLSASALAMVAKFAFPS